ncbi:GNAT family N-acetyltransferase [Alkaliflexus imshenetskii]|uniref:GNAT family N-acetyltransferase n=1 Tax=Alkaliflexus imshenetskii TaxID=286730 RepID=UPI00047DB03B|nr:GNAT family N-acetyltransferase [Alkaliflexus imshenetskii]
MKPNNIVKAVAVSREEYDKNFHNFTYSLFLQSGFLESVAPNGNAHYFNFIRNGEVVGKIAGVEENESRFMGKYLFVYAGPALKEVDETLYNECLVALKKCAPKHKFSRLNILYYDQQYQFKCKAKGYYVRTNREFVRRLEHEEQPLTFNKSFMYNVRKASKLNPVFYEETSERMLNKLHELLQKTWELRNDKFKGGYAPYPYKHMDKEAVDKMFHAGILKLYALETDGEIHCVRCAIAGEKRMYGIMIASDEFAYKNGLQHFLQHKLITHLHQEGYKYYNVSIVDFGEDGLVSYKESLGCKLYKVHGAYTHYIKYPQKMINPLMDTGRFIARNPFMKKIVKFGSKLIVGRDL